MIDSFLSFFTYTPFIILWAILALGAFAGSMLTSAPYGRHFRKGWGPSISNRWGWVIMELPALLIVPISFYFSNSSDSLHILLVVMWSVHYIHRTLFFPFQLKTKGKRMPLSIVLMAICFNFVNGCFVSTVFFQSPHLVSPMIIIGVTLFLLGMTINIASDYYLINLRDNKPGYSIPYGRWFKYLSCPNHFGEILEWVGFALVAQAVGPWLFALWTVANLLPRAISHHKWYLGHFPNYPKDRKAVFPFIL